MKLYYPKSHYSKAHRGLLFPLLKPFLKAEGYADAERIVTYGVSEMDFEFTDLLQEADLVILTMAWNYYVKTKQESLAITFVNECGALNKKVIAFNAGDFGVQIPYYGNLIVLRPSGYKSKFTNNEYALPAFIADPLKKYFETDKIFERPYQTKAIVGFCGQANPSAFNAAKEVFKTSLRNLKSFIGKSKDEAQQLLSTSFLRASVLQTLQNSKDIQTNFILRKKYRAGITEHKDIHSTTLEFYNNLKDSDYVVCVRGAGNFSVRFYETLAMGRIPVFINTDCALPLDKIIDWKKHVVWIEYQERKQVVEKVKKFHKTLTDEEFRALQISNRTIWMEKLSMNGFFNHFFNAIT
ncbi:exostosin domain-containing protein [Aequorivita vladivostokensis]|uniref:Exostosin GT47 domain-containing protein n=1 Tax=Aequorivita vladivostokensis TaxID=171194 RepID=A0ABR5DHD6_9FLAO|nr:exostosin family protein [Aequorivita vladivostokensis]KJJ38192.1 hypothetical protein MB09_08955 [Aequorivita vladivostokensis]